jgi:hypothetical protein
VASSDALSPNTNCKHQSSSQGIPLVHNPNCHPRRPGLVMEHRAGPAKGQLPNSPVSSSSIGAQPPVHRSFLFPMRSWLQHQEKTPFSSWIHPSLSWGNQDLVHRVRGQLWKKDKPVDESHGLMFQNMNCDYWQSEKTWVWR